MEKDKPTTKQVLRKKLICYFLAMAKAQQAVQQLQQQLIMHPYFNPILLFKKISQGHSSIFQRAFIQHLQSKIGTVSRLEIESYMKKHKLGRAIECEQFIATLLPYAPDILRNSQATVVWQVKSSPGLKKDVQNLYIAIVKAQIYHIASIASFRRQITHSWTQLKTLIEKDLTKNCPILEKRLIETETNMMKIRRWMELWIEVREKDVLDMARWMGGASEEDVKGYFNKVGLDCGRCSCHWEYNDQIIKLKREEPKKDQTAMLRSLSAKPLSKKEQEMLDRKISYIVSESESVKDGKKSPFPRSASLSNQFMKSSTAYSTDKKENNQEKPLSLWCQYTHTILTGQKYLSQNRNHLKSNMQRVHTILRQSVMSKKKQRTKIRRLLEFMSKYCQITSGERKLMDKYLQDLSISNQVIISIFNVGLAELGAQSQAKLKDQLSQIKQQKDSNKKIKKQMAQTLKQYCMTKSKLIQISRQAISNNYHQQMFKMLVPKQESILNRETLAKILTEMKIEHCLDDLEILMRHFGDGNQINEQSFSRVFNIQGN